MTKRKIPKRLIAALRWAAQDKNREYLLDSRDAALLYAVLTGRE